MAGEGDDVLLLLPEIWTEILVRLPVKSILQCRSVCKSWYSLISSPNFITEHSAKNGKRVLLQLYDNRANLTSYSSHDESFIESSEHDDDLPEAFLSHGSSNIQIVGSCNGLICLSKLEVRFREDDDGVSRITFLIWNPLIKKTVEVPSRIYRNKSVYCYGFGFDSNIGDYKVVFMVGAKRCMIFDLRRGRWRKASPLARRLGVEEQPEFYLNGAVHWKGWGRENGSNGFLLAFNMTDECFRKIEMPNSIEFTDSDDDASYVSTRSVAFSGLVHVIVWKSGEDDNVDMSESCSVWAMKEYGVTESWTKLFSIDLSSAQVLPTTQLWPDNFLFWETGEILMMHDLEVGEDEDFGHKHDLVLYNTESRKCKHLFRVTKCISSICIYEESLALM